MEKLLTFYLKAIFNTTAVNPTFCVFLCYLFRLAPCSFMHIGYRGPSSLWIIPNPFRSASIYDYYYHSTSQDSNACTLGSYLHKFEDFEDSVADEPRIAMSVSADQTLMKWLLISMSLMIFAREK